MTHPTEDIAETEANSSKPSEEMGLSEKGRSALALARRGFRVFPLRPNRKAPVFKGGFYLGTTDVAQIIEWWTLKPNANIGIRTGAGLLLIDLDRKNGLDGVERLEELDMLYGPVPWDSLGAETASGGRHIFVSYDPSLFVGCSTSKLAPGIDIKADGGLAVGVGSRINEKPYVATGGPDILPCPEWLLDRIIAVGATPHGGRAERGEDFIDGEDTETSVGQAVAYLRREDVPISVEGAGGNSTAFAVACFVRDFGVSRAMCLELMLEHWNERCAPPWDIEELEKTVWNAYRYARSEAPGARSAEGVFDRIPDEDCGEDEPESAAGEEQGGEEEQAQHEQPESPPEPEGGASKLNLHTASDWLRRDIQEPDFLLGELFSTTSRAMLVAPTGLGKTLMGIGFAFHMAAGVNFLHWSIARPCKVLYIEGEMSRRLLKKRISDEVKRCGMVPTSLTILSTEDFPEFKPLNTVEGQKFVESVIEQLGGVDFVIFDNIMCLISGDMKEELPWTQTLPWMRSLSARSIGQLWVHHTGHDASHSYGTKTREWQMDAVIMLEKLEEDTGTTGFNLKFSKHRERTPDNRADYADTEISIGEDGWNVTNDAGTVTAKLTPKERAFFEVLQSLFERGECKDAPQTEQYPRGIKVVTQEQWREALKRSGAASDCNSTERANWSRVRLALKAKGRVGEWDGLVWLITS